LILLILTCGCAHFESYKASLKAPVCDAACQKAEKKAIAWRTHDHWCRLTTQWVGVIEKIHKERDNRKWLCKRGHRRRPQFIKGCLELVEDDFDLELHNRSEPSMLWEMSQPKLAPLLRQMKGLTKGAIHYMQDFSELTGRNAHESTCPNSESLTKRLEQVTSRMNHEKIK